jgi:REP element-mobilizing transposase RayT
VKARRRVLSEEIATTLHEALIDCAASLHVTLLAFHIEPEHIYVLASHRPEMAVATVMGRLKGAASRRLWQIYPALRDLDERLLWNDG